ncbi:hypothetical protein [Enterobacter cloacae]|uniref:hypothetical protein n=1 Tax=Enterobacter cloacae TaxID=550 RepID=UPI0012B9B617|nr:hypothetical protein [Enterobacter cloacae]
MLDLLTYPDVERWLNDAIRRHSSEIYGKIKPAVVWTNALDEEGQLIVPIDPNELSRRINRDPFIILHNHDPGNPKGQVLESAVLMMVLALSLLQRLWDFTLEVIRSSSDL